MTRKTSSLAAALVVLISILIAVAGPAGGATQRPVLGGKAYAPHGSGFGTARPREIFNGGDPSGLVTSIRWRSWGGKSAFGSGRGSIFRPEGGYYPQQVTIKLWAHGLGHCPGSTRRAYRRLSFRSPDRPGGPLGPWRSWSGSRTICSFP
jgi:hypothetical protein